MLTLFALIPPTAAMDWSSQLSNFTTHTVPSEADHVRLVLLGDTGADAVPPDVESSHIPASKVGALRASVRQEEANAIFDLGDLVYGVMGPFELSPRCTDPSRGRASRLLPALLGDYYDGMGATT